MVYNTELVFFLFCPMSNILETRKHNVSETGIFPASGVEGKTPTQLGPSDWG
jgi:hypothetical protein